MHSPVSCPSLCVQAALDSNSERIVQEALDALLQSSTGAGMTKIVIAHRLATIRYADVIFVMSEGQLVEQGTHAELMNRAEGLYRQLALAQDPNAASGISTSTATTGVIPAVGGTGITASS